MKKCFPESLFVIVYTMVNVQRKFILVLKINFVTDDINLYKIQDKKY